LSDVSWFSYQNLTAGLPETFAGLREKLFILAERLANTDPEVLERDLTKPETSYLFGWSHGKEVMNGVSLLYWPKERERHSYADPGFAKRILLR